MTNFRLLTIFYAIFSSLTAIGQNARDTSLVLKEARISANISTETSNAGSIKVKADMIKRATTLLGEPDLIKTLQIMPGIQAATEGLSGYHVRGGGTDENLIILDGIPVYTQGHALGLFSAFQSEIVEEATLYKGAFPARLGGRASSALEIKTASGSPDRAEGLAGAGLLSDKFQIQGPLGKSGIKYSISGRGAHTFLMDGVFKAFRVPGNFHFHDLLVRAESPVGTGNTLSVNYFTSKDNLYYNEDNGKTEISWGSSAGGLTWKRDWNISLRSETIAAYSAYSTLMAYKDAETGKTGYRTGLEDYIVKTDFDWTGAPGHQARIGAGIIRHLFSPESDESDKAMTLKGMESYIYLEDNYNPLSRLSIDYGLRLSVFGSGGSTKVNPEPRFSVTINPWDRYRVTASYSRISQYIHQLSPAIAVLPVDLIVPVTDRIPPVLSDQVSVWTGYRNPNGWELSLEAYWKSTRNVLEYKDDIAFIDDFETWEDDVAVGIGRSYGIETLARKSSGKTNGWLGYTLSWSERRFPDKSVSGGRWFPSRNDHRHSVTVSIERELGGGWDSGVVWTYSSGGAITLPEGDGTIPVRGNVRLPSSHRLDIGLNHHKKKRKGERIWNLGLYNAYNRKNPNLVFLVAGDEDEGQSLRTVSFLPVIPSAGYTRVF